MGNKRLDGYHIELRYNNGGEDIRDIAESIKSGFLNASDRYCRDNSYINMGPYPEHPLIWTSGPIVEVVEFFSSAADARSKYTCKRSWNRFLCFTWDGPVIATKDIPCWND